MNLSAFYHCNFVKSIFNIVKYISRNFFFVLWYFFCTTDHPKNGHFPQLFWLCARELQQAFHPSCVFVSVLRGNRVRVVDLKILGRICRLLLFFSVTQTVDNSKARSQHPACNSKQVKTVKVLGRQNLKIVHLFCTDLLTFLSVRYFSFFRNFH